jgi:hypothetical protein
MRLLSVPSVQFCKSIYSPSCYLVNVKVLITMLELFKEHKDYVIFFIYTILISFCG